MSDPDILRQTFNEAALLYDKWRPKYPNELFDDLVALSGIPYGGSILEIGVGTGQATIPLAARGYKILGVELGEQLAQIARQNLAPFPQVEIQVGAFEEMSDRKGEFDLVTSATAFHWIDPQVSHAKAAKLLRPGGAIGLFWNEHVYSLSCSAEFFEEGKSIYEEIVPEYAVRYKGLLAPEQLADLKDWSKEIDNSGLFGSVEQRSYLWNQTYTSESYIGLLRTFSDNISLPVSRRDILLGKLGDLIDQKFGGKIVKTYLSLLYVAKVQNP